MRGAVLLLAAALAGCATTPHKASTAPVASVPKTYQWLHGSGEAAILQQETYRDLTRYVREQAEARRAGRAVESVVLATGGSVEAPRWQSCGSKPLAAVFDMDETVILNTGANYDAARRGDPPFDAARWDKWERTGAPYVEAVPGATAAIAAIRAAGVTPVFISNRRSANAAGAMAALTQAGLGPARQGETLFLQGDVAPGSGKDPRRAAAAARWCVVAMAGDQLGDFSDLFNDKGLSVQARRQRAQAPTVSGKWGAGWFLLPNPVYGPGVAGTLDDLFPAATRWSPPQENK